LLKWIVGAKVDHPLADPKQARALVAELPGHDYLKSLDEITRWLESLNEVEGFKLERLFEIVELLDSTARPHQRRLMQEYLGMSRQQKFQENKLWTCGYKFAKAVGDTYLLCVRRYQSGASGAGTVKKQVPLFVARGVRALAVQVKWTMLRYGPFEPRLWSSIGELYSYAEKSAFVRTELTIYPGAVETCSVEQEYLKVMMLWASSADVLPPLKRKQRSSPARAMTKQRLVWSPRLSGLPALPPMSARVAVAVLRKRSRQSVQSCSRISSSHGTTT